MASQTSKYKVYFNVGASYNNLFIFNYCYIRNKILVYRNYLFHNFIFTLWHTNLSRKYTMYIITRMKYTGSISLFMKSIISTFVKRSIQKYMHKSNTKNVCTSGLWVGKGGGTLILYKHEYYNNILVPMSLLCDLLSRHKANTLALKYHSVIIQKEWGWEVYYK